VSGQETLVCCGIAERDGKILIARRKRGSARAGLWEFPGGKVEGGESPEECLAREFLEELDLRIGEPSFFLENTHAYEDILIRLLAYRVRILEGEPKALDHEELRFISLSELGAFDFSAADLPIASALALSVPS
jgi:8-oxo-dGTP diphosphatase